MPRISVATDARLHKFAARSASGLMQEEAVTKLFRWLKRLPDPDEVLFKLGRNRATLRALEGDDEIIQCVDTRREAVVAMPWRIEPQQDATSQFIAEQLAPHMEDLICGAISAVWYGYSVVEVVYTEGARVGIDFVAEKKFEWFVPSNDGTVRYFPDDGSGGVDGLETDPRKYLLTRRGGKKGSNPYGDALFSRLYWPYYFKSQGRRFWAQFLERFGFPILVGQVSDGAAFVEAMTDLGMVSPIAVPPGSSVEAIVASQSGEFERFDRTFTTSIQKLILGQTLTSDVGTSGSYAAAKVHDSVREDKRNADVRMVTRTVQTLINHLAALNGLPAPQFVLEDDASLDFDQVARLIELKAIKPTSQLLEDWGMNEGDYELVADAPPPAPQVPLAPAEPALPAAMAAFAAPRFTAEQQVLEHGIAATLAELNSTITDAEIRAAIRLATSPRDLHDRLLALLENADGADFQRTFERALFAADIIGYAHASAGAAA